MKVCLKVEGGRLTRRALGWVAMSGVALLSGVGGVSGVAAPNDATDKKVVLVVTADAGDYILAAGGTIAAMIDDGAEAYLIRVTNDDKDSWNLNAGRDRPPHARRERKGGQDPGLQGGRVARLSRRRAGRCVSDRVA